MSTPQMTIDMDQFHKLLRRRIEHYVAKLSHASPLIQKSMHKACMDATDIICKVLDEVKLETKETK